MDFLIGTEIISSRMPLSVIIGNAVDEEVITCLAHGIKKNWTEILQRNKLERRIEYFVLHYEGIN